jgi:hypothetical protein
VTSKFGVVSVTEKHCSTSLVKEVELQAQIPQENKLGVMPQLTRKTTVNFQTKDKKRVFINTTLCLSQIVTATMFSPVYETSNGISENRTMSFS